MKTPAREVTTMSERPCERCVFVPTPDGKCICRKRDAVEAVRSA